MSLFVPRVLGSPSLPRRLFVAASCHCFVTLLQCFTACFSCSVLHSCCWLVCFVSVVVSILLLVSFVLGSCAARSTTLPSFCRVGFVLDLPSCGPQFVLSGSLSSCVLLCNLRRLARGSALRKPNLVLRLRAALCNLPIQPLWLCARLARGTLTSDLRVLQLRAQENSRVVYAFDDEVVSELRSAGAGALGAPPSGLGPAPGPALRV